MKAFLSSILRIALPFTILAACSGSGSGNTSDGGAPDTGKGKDSGKPPVDTGPAPCVESNCLPGNKCLPDPTGVVLCQLPCGAQPGQTPPSGGDGACPFNYTCTDFPAGTPAGSAERAYCTPNKKQVKAGPGLWGDPCLPSDGITKNKACDSSQGFLCNAPSPADVGVCTTQCSSDADCRGGWWCATQNLEPNATSNARRTDGKTIQLCQQRDYCSSCKSDVDCDSTTGVVEHCIKDQLGTRYCAPECKKDNNCAPDAQCVTVDQSALCSGGGGGTCVCAARARECTGDGLLCSPCLSDADCMPFGGGLCLTADYSTEHFCGVPSGKKAPVCSVSGSSLIADCPTSDEAPAPAKTTISCLTGHNLYDPPNQCVGLVVLGSTGSGPQYVLGCWSHH